MFGIGTVQHKAIGLPAIPDGIIVIYTFQDPPGNLPVSSSFFLRYVPAHFQQSAYCNGCRGRVSGFFAAIGKFQIPERNQILRQMIQKIFAYLFKQFRIFFSVRISVGGRKSVDPPCLSSGPCRTVPIALTGGSVIRRTGLWVKEKCMPGRIVFTDQIGKGGMDMGICDLTVTLLPGLLPATVFPRCG